VRIRASISAATIALLAVKLGWAQLAYDPASSLATGASPRCVRAGDLDGDGDQDLVVAHEGSNDVRIFTNDGNGGFSLTATLPAGLGVTWIVIANLDADLHPDLAITFRDSNALGVYWNDGSGGFSTGTQVAMPGGPVSVVAADLDNDGDLDFASTNEFVGIVSIVLNNGNGTFGPRADVTTGTIWPVSVAAGDFNGDGFRDLVVSHFIGGAVAVLLNSVAMPGTFTVSGTFATGSGSFGIVTSNFDANPALDFAVAVMNSNAVLLFSGDGAGGFSPSTVVPVGGGPTSLVLADFDGDQVSDLAVSEYWQGSVSILRRSGPAAFAAPIVLPTAAGCGNVGSGDLDGDGDIDLLGANHLAASISVVFRTLLGANGFGNVGVGAGGPFENLRINGTAGGRDRHVTVGLNQPFTISVTQPPTNPLPSDSILFGQLGIPNPLVDATVLPYGIGTSCIRVCALFPTATDLFFVANSYGVAMCGPPLLSSTPAPWTSPPLSLPFAVTATIQGVIIQNLPTVRVTNGIVLTVN
jgi:hypothetical protein